jgi:hypothetical protein
MRLRARGAALIICMSILSACGGTAARSYPGTATLAHALNNNGVSCTAFTARTGGGRSTEGAAAPVKKGAKPLVKESGECSHGDTKLLLFTFTSAAMRDRWLHLGKLYGSVVVGPNWTVSSPSKDLADRVSGAIGGDVR